MLNVTARPAGRAVGSLLLGVVVALLGTVMHRSEPPWGIAACLALVLAAAVTSRAWGGLVAVGAFAVGWCAIVVVLSGHGPGGDVLIPASGGTSSKLLGQVWLLGSWVPIGAAAFLPSRWFSDVVPVADISEESDGAAREVGSESTPQS